jgi:hypothetical protein
MAFPRALWAGNNPTDKRNAGANRATVQVLWRQADGYSAEPPLQLKLDHMGPSNLGGTTAKVGRVQVV